mgnify:CR=1 FL=1
MNMSESISCIQYDYKLDDFYYRALNASSNIKQSDYIKLQKITGFFEPVIC